MHLFYSHWFLGWRMKRVRSFWRNLPLICCQIAGVQSVHDTRCPCRRILKCRVFSRSSTGFLTGWIEAIWYLATSIPWLKCVRNEWKHLHSNIFWFLSPSLIWLVGTNPSTVYIIAYPCIVRVLSRLTSVQL